MLSDAPAHHLFCLLGPVDPQKKALPEVLAVIQVKICSRIKVKLNVWEYNLIFAFFLNRCVSKVRFQRRA